MDGHDGGAEEASATLEDEKDIELEEDEDTLDEGTNFVRKTRKLML